MSIDGAQAGQVLLIGMAAGLATLSGGWLALRLGPGVGPLTGLGGGAVIGVALMDLLPEALDLGRSAHQPLTLLALTVAGFMAYVVVGRLSQDLGARSQGLAARLGPASLVLHSVMDGLGVGVAFHVSSAAGLVVAAAVLAHDLVDGANTVTISAAGGLGPVSSRRWLMLDAAAPLVGIGLSLFIKTSPAALSLWLAVFAGLFLYIGASVLLRRRPAASGLADVTGRCWGRG